MSRRFFTQIVFIFLILTTVMDVQATELKKDYHPEATLTEEEEQTVKELARKAGIQEIGSISTHPFSLFEKEKYSYYIEVREKEKKTEKGEVSFRTLHILSKKWEKKPKEKKLIAGDFWVNGQIQEKKDIILPVEGKLYRMSAQSVITREKAEKFLSKLCKGEYEKDYDWPLSSRQAPSPTQIDFEKSFSLYYKEKSKSYLGFFKLKDGEQSQVTLEFVHDEEDNLTLISVSPF